MHFPKNKENQNQDINTKLTVINLTFILHAVSGSKHMNPVVPGIWCVFFIKCMYVMSHMGYLSFKEEQFLMIPCD